MQDVNKTNDNMTSHLVYASVETEIAKKTGNPYYMLVTEWLMSNDKTYKCRLFINDEQKTLIESSVALEVHKQFGI